MFLSSIATITTRTSGDMSDDLVCSDTTTERESDGIWTAILRTIAPIQLATIIDNLLRE